MSDWIRVTPETMPPDSSDVLVTLLGRDGGRWVFEQKVVYASGMFTTENDSGYLNPIQYFVPDGTEVTHWMPYPAPAQD